MKTKQIHENITASEEAALLPLSAVTSDGIEKETELMVSPLVLPQAALHAIEEKLSRLEEMNTGICLNAKYKEFSALGEVVRGIFLGIKTITKGRGAERQEIPAVQWIDAEKQLWLNAGVILVNQLRDVPSGTPIEIIYTEKIKMDIGIAKNYEVRALYE